MEYISHSWINEGSIEKRAYQENITKTALRGNCLCVLPTGLGKTPLAAMVAAHRLQKDMNSKILFLAPTKPLVEQHRRSFAKMLKIGPSELRVVTGETKSVDRKKLYEKADVVFSTPQTIRNDLKGGLFSLRKFSLCIFDEAHRCVGAYAYTYIAKRYMQEAADPLILALTASPGSSLYKINDIKKHLSIDYVEIRSKDDKDVKPYVQKAGKEFVEVKLPQEMKSLFSYLTAVKNQRLKKLYDWKIIRQNQISKSFLLSLQEKLLKNRSGRNMAALSMVAQVIKVDHALLLAETQCLSALNSYFQKLETDTTKAAARLLKDETFQKAMRLTNDLLKEGKEHPKMEKLKEVVAGELENKDSRIIVFAQYRDTIAAIAHELQKLKNAAPVEFIGQAKKKGKGLSQKEQVQILNEFSMGFHNILCASQVAEEGLDVVETNVVVFYEPTPSAVRKIQRSGRTARTQEGHIVVLIAKDTRDEAYHWAAHHKERKMKKTLYGMQKQHALSEFK